MAKKSTRASTASSNSAAPPAVAEAAGLLLRGNYLEAFRAIDGLLRQVQDTHGNAPQRGSPQPPPSSSLDVLGTPAGSPDFYSAHRPLRSSFGLPGAAGTSPASGGGPIAHSVPVVMGSPSEPRHQLTDDDVAAVFLIAGFSHLFAMAGDAKWARSIAVGLTDRYPLFSLGLILRGEAEAAVGDFAAASNLFSRVERDLIVEAPRSRPLFSALGTPAVSIRASREHSPESAELTPATTMTTTDHTAAAACAPATAGAASGGVNDGTSKLPSSAFASKLVPDSSNELHADDDADDDDDEDEDDAPSCFLGTTSAAFIRAVWLHVSARRVADASRPSDLRSLSASERFRSTSTNNGVASFQQQNPHLALTAGGESCADRELVLRYITAARQHMFDQERAWRKYRAVLQHAKLVGAVVHPCSACGHNSAAAGFVAVPPPQWRCGRCPRGGGSGSGASSPLLRSRAASFTSSPKAAAGAENGRGGGDMNLSGSLPTRSSFGAAAAQEEHPQRHATLVLSDDHGHRHSNGSSPHHQPSKKKSSGFSATATMPMKAGSGSSSALRSPSLPGSGGAAEAGSPSSQHNTPRTPAASSSFAYFRLHYAPPPAAASSSFVERKSAGNAKTAADDDDAPSGAARQRAGSGAGGGAPPSTSTASSAYAPRRSNGPGDGLGSSFAGSTTTMPTHGGDDDAASSLENSTNSRNQPSVVNPKAGHVWAPDSLKACQRCAKSIGRWTRHHCRSCGRIVCNGCSEKRRSVLILGFDLPSRVCNNCADVLDAASSLNDGGA